MCIRNYLAIPALLLVISCAKGKGEIATQPWAEDLNSAQMNEYRPLPGSNSECIGRLNFETDRFVQWPTFFGSKSSLDWSGFFSPNFRTADRIEIGQYDRKFGRVVIAVFKPDSGELANRIKHELPSLANGFYEERIRVTKRLLAEEKGEVTAAKSAYQIELLEERLNGYEAEKAEIVASKSPLIVGRKDVEGYSTTVQERNGDSYSVLRAYLTSETVVFVFESTRLIDKTSTRGAHSSEFALMLKRFRVRAPGEVPKETGICIPFGFLPDDGSTKVNILQSMRLADAPNVAYTIHTGNYDQLKGNGPGIRAAALAATGLLGSSEEDQLKKQISIQRIGPRDAKIGGLKGIQGRFAAKIALPGEPPYEYYSVLTGYRGWEGNDTLPFIVVEMSAKLKTNAPELKDNPPPFAQSMSRLEALLKTVRLRASN